ncbi:hypothetical protein TNCV_3056161 [Trichonephila clavipes]|nr:hypothetical protein TNCV_3056161 [Trichonephila clavipes]
MSRFGGLSEERDLQCLRPQASLVLIYRPNVAGMKGIGDLAPPVIEPQTCGVEAQYTTTRPYSGPSESVQEFAARINKLGTQIFQSGNSAQNTAVRNANDQLLQSRFISGLRNEIRRFVLSRDPSNLDESINAALIEEQNMKLNQIASEERSGLSSAQTENPVLSALADRLEEINLRVGSLQEASSVTARKSGGDYFNRRENVFKCFYCGIQRHRQADCRKRRRGENAAHYQLPRRNAASEYSIARHPGSDGRHVHFRESAFRDNYAAPRHPVRGSHTNSGNRGFQRYNRNETLNSRGESRI